MSKYIIKWGYLKTIKQVQCIKSDNMAFGTLRSGKDIGLFYPSKVWSECKKTIETKTLVWLKGNYDNSNSKIPCFTVCGIFDEEKEACFFCGKVDDYKMYLYNDGRYFCKTCRKIFPEEKKGYFNVFYRKEITMLNDEDIEEMLR